MPRLECVPQIAPTASVKFAKCQNIPGAVYTLQSQVPHWTVLGTGGETWHVARWIDGSELSSFSGNFSGNPGAVGSDGWSDVFFNGCMQDPGGHGPDD